MYFVDSDNFALINDDTVIFIIIIFNIIISNYYWVGGEREGELEETKK